MDHEPTVWPIEWGELLEFCTSAGYRCRLEPAGSLLIPPDYNVGMTDWEKSLKLRKGEFSVLGAEPSSQTAPTSQSTLFPPGWAYEAFDAPWASEQPAQLQGERRVGMCVRVRAGGRAGGTKACRCVPPVPTSRVQRERGAARSVPEVLARRLRPASCVSLTPVPASSPPLPLLQMRMSWPLHS